MRQVVRILLQSLLLSAAALALPVLASDASVAARLDAQGIQYTIDRDGDYRVVYNYAQDNRTQLLFVSGRTEAWATSRSGISSRRLAWWNATAWK